MFLQKESAFANPLSYNTNDHPVAVAVGDFNRGGMPDLAVSNWHTNDVTIYA